jgi:ParB family chromosome partitioning protein
MPKLEDIKRSKTKRDFVKREYRPWDLDGSKSQPSPSPSQLEAIDQKNILLEVSPEQICNWEFHDRPENELGDLQSLADEFKDIGQQQPCIVRPIHNNQNAKYELIVGERRWRASIIAGLKLKVIVKDLSDSESAIIQASENSNRKDLSDYAKGMSYFNLISKDIISQSDLSRKLNISKQQVNRLMAFGKIPEEIKLAINDLSKISARTAEQIKHLSTRGDDYISAIISLADQLRLGSIGHEKLTSLVESKIKNAPRTIDNSKIYSKSGRHMFTWRRDNNLSPSIHFPKDIVQLLVKNKIDHEEITRGVLKLLDELVIKIDD